MREVRPEPLEPVVEVRQVGQRQRGRARLHHVQRGARDPVRGGDVGERPPELEQREPPEPRVELVVQLGRMGVMIGDLAPVGRVHRARRRGPLGGGVHVVPPEHLGAGEARVPCAPRLPDLLAGDEPVGLAPQQHLAQVAEVPAVGHRAVARGHQPRQQGGLRGAGDGRRHGAQRSLAAARGEAGEVGRVRPDQVRREPHDQDHEGGRHRRAPLSGRGLRAGCALGPCAGPVWQGGLGRGMARDRRRSPDPWRRMDRPGRRGVGRAAGPARRVRPRGCEEGT